MPDLYFTIGCLSMATSIFTQSFGHHGGIEYELKEVWKNSVNFQQLGSLSLLFVGSKVYRHIPGGLFLLGTCFFCLPCYYYAYTKDRQYNFLMPYGGMAVMAGWVALGLLA